MSKPSKPLKLWAHNIGPNPFKVEIILLELGLPYQKALIEFPDMKKPAYEAVNPNGRVPTLEDPNTGISIWESGAIIQYLIETYDKEHILSSASTAGKWKETQWLHFQMSGQGPYFGQATWFKHVHKEKLPSAIERYESEIRRVTMVLDRELKDKEYLIDNKVTYADLAFAPWYWVIIPVCPELFAELEREYPSWKAWKDRMEARPTVERLHTQRREGLTKMIASGRFQAQPRDQKEDISKS